MQKKSETNVTSLKRAIELLQALSELGPSRISDLSRHLGYTQATTHRLLQQLTEGELVSQFPADKRYALGLGLATLCLLYTSPSPRDYAASRMPSSA